MSWKGLISSFFLGRPFNKLVVFNCICKKNWFCSFQKKNFSHSTQSAITHLQSFRGCHNASLLLSPQDFQSDPPFLGCQGGDQPPLLRVGVGPNWGLAPGPTWPCGHSWWDGPSLQWVQLGLGHPESQNTGPKENPEYHQVARLLTRLGVPSHTRILRAHFPCWLLLFSWKNLPAACLGASSGDGGQPSHITGNVSFRPQSSAELPLLPGTS